MSLKTCPDCNEKMSDKALFCVHCGFTPCYNSVRSILVEANKDRIRHAKKKKILTISILATLALFLLGIGAFWYLSPDTFLALFNKNQIAFEQSQNAYEKLHSAQEQCEIIMDDIYEAWRWGIYDYDEDMSSSEAWSDLLGELRISNSDMENLSVDEEGKGTGKTTFSLYMILSDEDSKWQVPLNIVQEAYQTNGTIEKIQMLLAEAKDALKSISESNSDYEYYPTLKLYYSEVSSYFEFIKSPSGSFEQLKTTITGYENKIRTYSEDLSFVFAN